MKNLLSIESLTRDDIERIVFLSHAVKANRGSHAAHPLRDKCWALMFSKSSTRTRYFWNGVGTGQSYNLHVAAD